MLPDLIIALSAIRLIIKNCLRELFQEAKRLQLSVLEVCINSQQSERRCSAMKTIKVRLMMQSIAVGLTFRKMTLYNMKIFLIVQENSFGQVSIIWENRLLIIQIGLAIVLFSELQIWQVFPKTVFIFIGVIGIGKKRLYIYCLIGRGKDVREKSRRYLYILIILRPNYSLMERVRGKEQKT